MSRDGEWLRKSHPVIPHRCRPLTHEGSFAFTPDGASGDVWRCACGVTWIIRGSDRGRYWSHPVPLGPVWWRFTALPALGRFINAVIDGLTSFTR